MILSQSLLIQLLCMYIVKFVSGVQKCCPPIYLNVLNVYKMCTVRAFLSQRYFREWNTCSIRKAHILLHVVVLLLQCFEWAKCEQAFLNNIICSTRKVALKNNTKESNNEEGEMFFAIHCRVQKKEFELIPLIVTTL